MPNRRTSILLQAATIVVLSAAWLLTRRHHRRQQSDRKYGINPARAALLSTILLAADVWAIPKILRGKRLIDTDELGSISHALVPRFDRIALDYEGHRAGHYRSISDKVLMTIVAAPLMLFANPRIRADWRSVAGLYAWAQSLCYTLYSFSPLGPAFVDKYRPVVYYSGLADTLRNAGNNRNARFSGHTAAAACATFFAAKAYSDYRPELSVVQRRSLYLSACFPALLLGRLRTKALKHFPSDVLVAILIGGAFGRGIPQMYRQRE